MINFGKFSITFGKTVEDGARLIVRGFSGIVNEGRTRTYLGLPECLSDSKTKLFNQGSTTK